MEFFGGVGRGPRNSFFRLWWQSDSPFPVLPQCSSCGAFLVVVYYYLPDGSTSIASGITHLHRHLVSIIIRQVAALVLAEVRTLLSAL